MRVGYVGCGKLGMPCAMVTATRHDVVAYDPSPLPAEILRTRKYPYQEALAQEYLDRTTLRMVPTIADCVAHADIVLVAVQTPHGALYEGVTRIPETRADFDYSYLKSAVAEISAAAKAQQKKVIVDVISTVLPGTINREVKPLLNEFTPLVYTPYFIAMGSTIPDAIRPEFVLLGVDDPDAADVIREFYATFTVPGTPVREMSIKSAELTKIAYNVFIGQKIGFANLVMQLAHETGADCDDVTDALGQATDRIISKKYLRGGGGDSGGCHPRDLIALSWVSDKLGFKYNLADTAMKIREEQTDWLATLLVDKARDKQLPIVVLGKAYKKDINLTVGSYSVLLKNLLDERAYVKNRPVDHYDPFVDERREFTAPAVFIIATNHTEFYSMKFPEGSTVFDPWGDMKDQPGVEVVRIGRHA